MRAIYVVPTRRLAHDRRCNELLKLLLFDERVAERRVLLISCRRLLPLPYQNLASGTPKQRPPILLTTLFMSIDRPAGSSVIQGTTVIWYGRNDSSMEHNVWRYGNSHELHGD